MVPERRAQDDAQDRSAPRALRRVGSLPALGGEQDLARREESPSRSHVGGQGRRGWRGFHAKQRQREAAGGGGDMDYHLWAILSDSSAEGSSAVPDPRLRRRVGLDEATRAGRPHGTPCLH